MACFYLILSWLILFINNIAVTHFLFWSKRSERERTKEKKNQILLSSGVCPEKLEAANNGCLPVPGRSEHRLQECPLPVGPTARPPVDIDDLIHLPGPLTEDALLKALAARFHDNQTYVRSMIIFSFFLFF